MAIFSNHLISISPNPLCIHLNLFLSLHQSKFMYIFFNLRFSISFYSTSINVNLFYLIFNFNSRLSSSISPFLSHSILHLSKSMLFYLLANLIDAYLSLLQILNPLSTSYYLPLEQKENSPLLRYFIFFFYKGDYTL